MAVETGDKPAEASAAGIPGNIRMKMAKGVGWTVVARLGVQGIGLLSILILARLLVPADFGLVALATAFCAALLAMSEFGFDTVLIQNRQATRQHYDTAWTMAVVRNAVLAVCLVVGAVPAAAFFGDARIEMILYCLALSTVIDGLENIGIVEFRKNLDFRRDMIFMVGGKLASFCVTVPLAIALRNYWALVAGIMASSFVKVALSYMMHSYRPRPCLVHWREIMRFSRWLILQNLTAFVYHRVDVFIIGKVAGTAGVGLYSMALEIAQMVTSNLIAPVRRAVFPAYASLSSDLGVLGRNYADVFGAVALIGTPVALGIGLVAEPMVTVMLGAKWTGVIPVLQVLCIYGFVGVLGVGSGPVYLALARPYYLTWTMAGGLALMIPAMYFGVRHFGLVGAACALTGGAALVVLADFTIVLRLLRLPVRHLLTRVWRPLTAAALMAAAVIEVQLAWPDPKATVDSIGLLVASVLTGAVVYPAVVLALWGLTGRGDGAERQILILLGKAAAKVARRQDVAARTVPE